MEIHIQIYDRTVRLPDGDSAGRNPDTSIQRIPEDV